MKNRYSARGLFAKVMKPYQEAITNKLANVKRSTILKKSAPSKPNIRSKRTSPTSKVISAKTSKLAQNKSHMFKGKASSKLIPKKVNPQLKGRTVSNPVSRINAGSKVQEKQKAKVGSKPTVPKKTAPSKPNIRPERTSPTSKVNPQSKGSTIEVVALDYPRNSEKDNVQGATISKKGGEEKNEKLQNNKLNLGDDRDLNQRLRTLKENAEICITSKGVVIDGKTGNLIAETEKEDAFGHHSYVLRDPSTTEEIMSFEKSRRCNSIASCIPYFQYLDIYVHSANRFLGKIKYYNTLCSGPRMEIYGSNRTKMYEFFIPSWKSGGKEMSSTGKYLIYNTLGHPVSSIGPISFDLNIEGDYIAKMKIGEQCPSQHRALFIPVLIELLRPCRLM